MLLRLSAGIGFSLAFGFGAVSVGAATLNESELDAIFGQAAFGSTPVDVRILPTQEIVAPTMVDVTLGFSFTDPTFQGELGELFALGSDGPVIDVIFVDSISSPFFGSIIGIAEVRSDGERGNAVAVTRGIAPDAVSELVAHEVGHALGLDHVGVDISATGTTIDYDIENLMSVGVNGHTDLDSGQVATVLASPYMQGNAASGYFVELRAYEVVAVSTLSQVALPPSLPLLGGAIWIGTFVGRRQRRTSSNRR